MKYVGKGHICTHATKTRNVSYRASQSSGNEKEKGAKVGKKNTYNLHAHVPRSKPRVDHTPYVQVLL